MLSVKKTLTKLLKAIDMTPITDSWSGIHATANQNNTLKSITLAANRQYIVLASNSNGIAGSQINNLNFNCTGATTLLIGAGLNNVGSGNACIAFAYVATGAAARTLNVISYGYSSSETWSGSVVAIPLGGSFVTRIMSTFSRLAERWWEYVEHKENAYKNTLVDEYPARNRHKRGVSYLHGKYRNRCKHNCNKSRILSTCRCWLSNQRIRFRERRGKTAPYDFPGCRIRNGLYLCLEQLRIKLHLDRYGAYSLDKNAVAISGRGWAVC